MNRYNRPVSRPTGSRYNDDFGYSMEHQNDEQVDLLSQKTSQLREITLSLGDEVRNQQEMLRGMETQFGATGDLLGQSMKRLQQMAKTQTGRWFLYMVLFVLVVVLYVYFFHIRK
ncbi:uncharacterized protein BJ171DRAFT_161295 [Polychytrium aggregatum]|uniref:uncharacterized protein n=1 Tax=Polychytrium aggregatum TaxID=110093 RepID=UPI0022FE91FF|nr:uncharacterized protein BJ171DRAFT_161295 [Polychytrium aggregatum]KAI9202788.1 hypothetical protein BJ171DRAFT_161295 [Polychytrium aggregatum]